MRFDPKDYETVEERIRRFYGLYPDGRIITDNLTTQEDRAVKTWIVKTTIYLSDADQANGLAKATGHAFEVDGGNGANATAALENAETSSIGRGLANMNLSGNKRATREEMAKVSRGPVKATLTNWEGKITETKSKAAARELWVEANQLGAGKDVLDKIQKLADSLEA